MMNIRRFLGSLCLVAAAGCDQPGSIAAEPRVQPVAAPMPQPAGAQRRSARPRVVFLGDSLTAGYGLERAQSVPSLIAARLKAEGYDYEVVNAGVSGDTSAGGLSRLEWSIEGDVRVLVVELGANDGLRGLPAAALKRNLDEIIRRAKQRGITVLLTGMEAPPNYGAAYTAEFRQVFSDLAREHKVPFVPFYLKGVAGIPSLNISDGIHPNPAGAQVVEGTIWRALEPLLQKPGPANLR
jgi:acyl-CoA thioesterase-1